MTVWNPESRPLTMSEMTDNSEYILGYLLSQGWTRNAICGMLGNMQSESTINPARWQGDNVGDTVNGLGLTQWTPATKYLDWCTTNSLDYKQMDSGLGRILYEVANNIQWFRNPLWTGPDWTWTEFTQSTDTPENLANVFIYWYEHPGNPDQPIRGSQARYWWDNLSGTGTINGGGGTTPTTDTNKQVISLLLSDTLNGWRW